MGKNLLEITDATHVVASTPCLCINYFQRGHSRTHLGGRKVVEERKAHDTGSISPLSMLPERSMPVSAVSFPNAGVIGPEESRGVNDRNCGRLRLSTRNDITLTSLRHTRLSGSVHIPCVCHHFQVVTFFGLISKDVGGQMTVKTPTLSPRRSMRQHGLYLSKAAPTERACTGLIGLTGGSQALPKPLPVHPMCYPCWFRRANTDP